MSQKPLSQLSPIEQVARLESALKNIIAGCDSMLQLSHPPVYVKFMREIRRVAQDPMR